MGLFSAIKNAFGEAIVLDRDKKSDLVVRQPLKNNELKLNSELDVEDGFDVVLCHMDSVCDCLSTGKYRFNDINTPRLYKFVKPRKTSKGLVSPKAIQADIYYVNKANIGGLKYLTHRRFKAMHSSKNVKIKIEGTFDVKVVDSKKFIATMLNDYATLRDDKVKLELGDYVSYSILRVVEKNIFNLDEFKANSEALINILNDEVAKELSKIGVEVSNIKITNVLTPRLVPNKKELSEKKDNRLDDIFSATYGSPLTGSNQGSQEAKRQEVLAGNIRENDGVINLGYDNKSGASSGSGASGNFGGNAFTSSISPNQRINDEQAKTDAEYKKMTESLANLNKKNNDLVFIGGPNGVEAVSKKEEVQEPPVQKHAFSPGVTPDFSSLDNRVQNAPQKPESDIMLGRTAIHDLHSFGSANIEDDYVQRQRQRDIKNIKDSIAEPIDRPKVMKSKNICKYCSNKLSPKDEFCPKCGKSTRGIKYCKACGEENDENATVCKMCGSKL